MSPPIDRIVESTTRNRWQPFAVRIRTVLLGVLFWGAVVLPAVYVPLFVFDPDVVPSTTAIALLAAHAGCLLASHSYTPE